MVVRLGQSINKIKQVKSGGKKIMRRRLGSIQKEVTMIISHCQNGRQKKGEWVPGIGRPHGRPRKTRKYSVLDNVRRRGM